MKCILGKKLLESFSLETELLLRKVCHGHVTDCHLFYFRTTQVKEVEVKAAKPGMY